MMLADAEVYDGLIKSCFEKKLPQSLLFAGSRMSGRLSAALSLAFHISGRDDDGILLEADNIVYIPQRNLNVSVSAAYNLLKEKTSLRMRNHFIREVRKALLQYHPALQDSGVDQKKDRLFEKAAAIQENLYSLIETDCDDKKAVLALADVVMADVLSKDFLSKGRKKGGLTVDDVRLVQNYLYRGGGCRFVIIENIEQAQDAAENALLKILEEPPEGGYFFLISDNPQRILPTILSRTVKYTFPSPTPARVEEFLKEEFYSSGVFDLEEFFFREAVDGNERRMLEQYAQSFHSMLLGREQTDGDGLNALFSFIEKSGGDGYFRKVVIGLLKKDMETSCRPYHELARLMGMLDRAAENMGVFNQGLRNAYDLVLREASVVNENS